MIFGRRVIQDVIQIIAEFRIQLFSGTSKVHDSLSAEITFLQHYIDSEACIIIANDCGAIVGYIAIVGCSEYHHALDQYRYYGDDLTVSEGPLVHPDYQMMGIAKGLMQEALNECEIKENRLLLIDPTHVMSDNNKIAIQKIASKFNFQELDETPFTYKKELLIKLANQLN